MKQFTMCKWLALIAVALWSFEALAYYDEKDKEVCRHPKVQELTLHEYQAPENKEVPAEAEFSFVVSGWSDPKKMKLSAKDLAIPFTVQSSDTYHKIKAKLPPELTGKFIRLNARIPAVLGCYTSIGWLIKVAGNAKAVEAPQPTTPAVKDAVAPSTGTVVMPPQNNVEVPKDPAASVAKPE